MKLQEILLLWYIHNKQINFSVPAYWSKDYGINNVPTAIQKFTKDGLVKLEVVKKKEKYVLTEKGEHTVADYPHIIYYHQYRNFMSSWLSLEAVDQLQKDSPTLDIQEVLIEYHKKQVREHFQNTQYIDRNGALTIGQIYMQQQDYSNALRYFFVVCYMDMSGYDENKRQYDERNRKHYQPGGMFYKTAEEIKAAQFLAPGVVSFIKHCSDNLGYTIDTLCNVFHSELERSNIPAAVYSKGEVWDLLKEQLKALSVEFPATKI